MENVRIAILNAYDNVLSYLDNNSDDAMHYCKDELHTYLTGSAYTFSFTTLQIYDDSKHLVVGNKLAFRYKNKNYYCNIVNTEIDGKHVKITSYGLSFELINEETGAYKSNGAMSFNDYIKAFNFEDQTFEIGLNEVSDKRITHEWEGTETVLARLFSLANVFDAELEFLPQLNDDYSLKNIVMNVYRKHDIDVQGMGKDRRSEVIRYGYSIKNITKTSDITELYTAIRPTGKDGLTLAGINKQEYDSNGNLEYSSPSGTIEILAPQARDRFPSNLMSGLNDRYIAKVWSYETDNVNTLYGQALAQLKKNCVPKTSYDIDGYIDANIGDTFTIEDTEYKPVLYLEARITEQIISFTDQTRNKTTFDNFKEVQSQISGDLINKMNAIIEANRLYKGEIISSNGIIFKENSDTTVLTAVISDGIKVVTSDFNVRWYKDNVLLTDSNVKIEVSVADLSNGKSVFRFEALNEDGVIKARAEVTVSKVSDGVDGITLYPHVKYSNNPDGNPMTDNSTNAVYIGVCVSESSIPPTDYKLYNWSKIKGDDGTNGIIVSTSAPEEPVVGQLWQTTSGQPIKIWNGNSWRIYYLSVDNLNVRTLSAITADLGSITAGSMNINDKFMVDRSGNMTAASGKVAGWNISDSEISTSDTAADGSKTSMKFDSKNNMIQSTLLTKDGDYSFLDVIELGLAVLNMYRTTENETGARTQATKIGVGLMEMNDATGNYFSGIYPEEIVVGRHTAQAPMVTLRPGSIVATYMANDPIGGIFFGVDTKTDETYVNFVSDSIRFNGGNIASFTYSTEEQWTGDYWLDGRKIYKKTIQSTINLFASGNVLHGINNIGTYRTFDTNNSFWLINGTCYCIGIYESSTAFIRPGTISDSHVSLSVGSSWSSDATKPVYVTIRYTKEEVSK